MLTSGEKRGDFSHSTFKRNKKDDSPCTGEPSYLNYNRLNSRLLGLFGLHVGVNVLNVVKIFQSFDHLIDGFTLFCGHLFQIVGESR